MNTIKPFELGKTGVDADATGVYNWEKQRYQYATSKWGTYNSTRQGTSSYFGSNTMPTSDDSNMDSYND